jgi:hypothetical protein
MRATRLANGTADISPAVLGLIYVGDKRGTISNRPRLARINSDQLV